MEDFAALLAQGKGWLFIPSAVVLGALHGLEPGHSKTMMAAFIVAVRGTVAQAVLLGLAATLSHTAVVWAIAMLGLTYGAAWGGEASEPYLKLVSGIMIVCVSLWIMARTAAERRARCCAHTHHHDHHHDHDHPHHHVHDGHDDAHARAHADEIRKVATAGKVTNGQIFLFGLTGGLIPCPAAITVLLICLQLKKLTLGIGLVTGFSVGLALTLVASGVAAAWGVRHAARKWSGFDAIAARAPYVSGVLIACIGIYVAWHGYITLVPISN